jgi:hypothetical protein
MSPAMPAWLRRLTDWPVGCLKWKLLSACLTSSLASDLSNRQKCPNERLPNHISRLILFDCQAWNPYLYCHAWKLRFTKIKHFAKSAERMRDARGCPPEHVEGSPLFVDTPGETRGPFIGRRAPADLRRGRRAQKRKAGWLLMLRFLGMPFPPADRIIVRSKLLRVGRTTF